MSARLRIVLMAAAAWLLITLTWGTYRAVGSGNSHGLPIVWVGVGLLLWGATAAGLAGPPSGSGSPGIARMSTITLVIATYPVIFLVSGVDTKLGWIPFLVLILPAIATSLVILVAAMRESAGTAGTRRGVESTDRRQPSTAPGLGRMLGAAALLVVGIPLALFAAAAAGLAGFSCSGGVLGEGCTGGSWTAFTLVGGALVAVVLAVAWAIFSGGTESEEAGDRQDHVEP